MRLLCVCRLRILTFTQINIGWKLALIEKGLAAHSLLDTYTEERLPVIKHMRQETVNVGKRFADEARDAENFKPALQSASHLKQFGVNYRWSSIVLDERFSRSPGDALDPYGLQSGDTLLAGDRAPNAMGLVRISNAGTVPEMTNLFNIFSPAQHTALIFGGNASVMASIIARYLQGVVASIAVLTSATAAVPIDGANTTLQDRDGVAYDAYHMSKEQTFVVIVRPDGVIGAFVSGEKGVAEYFNSLFSGVANV